LGEVPPAEFIPIAESSGLISSFDGVTAKLVSDLTQSWEARGIDLPIAFNLSAATLSSVKGAFLGEVFLRLGLRPGRTTIEITESAIMGHVATAQADIEGLVKAGFRVAIDDFGTGYSSLAYLQALPIQEVKIDRSFVARLGGPEERGSIAIIRAVLAIAEALGLETVAEGVETEAQLAWLKTQGCHRAQGFLFSRPLPVAEFEERYLCATGLRAG
jgi:EAL domain-containing protein (putative c-di-GMP-specific phosphodiesterase class I)